MIPTEPKHSTCQCPSCGGSQRQTVAVYWTDGIRSEEQLCSTCSGNGFIHREHAERIGAERVHGRRELLGSVRVATEETAMAPSPCPCCKGTGRAWLGSVSQGETQDVLADLARTAKLCREIDLEGNADLMDIAAAAIRERDAEIAKLREDLAECNQDYRELDKIYFPPSEG